MRPSAAKILGPAQALLLLIAVAVNGSSTIQPVVITAAAGPCPCPEAGECHPIKEAHGREVFGFCASPRDNHFESYDWSQLTTVAWVEEDGAMCHAHRKRSRVVLDSRADIMPALINISEQPSWVRQQLEKAVYMHVDGINFDLEDAASPSSPLAVSYTKLVRRTAAAFHRHIPGSQVSVDVPWSPFDVDDRWYDWQGLAAAADLLFIMSYDMQSQIYGKCIAAANSPAALVEKGLRQWLDLKIPSRKLVLGLPWYGYDYTCQSDETGRPMDPESDICHLQPIPFHGAPCSDAAGGQIQYKHIMNILKSGVNTTAVMWDEGQQSPWFNYRASDGRIHQVWFDNPESLTIKYELAARYGLRGVGIWHIEALDYESQDPDVMAQTADMWGALKAFTASGELLQL